MIVIGGGLAGLSSAVALAEAGCRVRLFEKRPHLGGRAASYVLPGGEHVDNCQHVTLGCCVNLEDFYRRVGASQKIRYYDRLLFSGPDGRRGFLESSPLPAPLHMAPWFAVFPLLGWADKFAIARAMLAIAQHGGPPPDAGSQAAGVTMLNWLRIHGQTDLAIRRFWEVVLVSALNEELGRMDARYGINVFWKAFLSNRAGYRVGIPSVPLGELYDGCRVAIERRGGEVFLRSGIRRLHTSGGRIVAAETERGDLETADDYIAALPYESLPALLPPGVAQSEPVFAGLRHLRVSPITSVHLWLDRPVMSEPFLALLDSTTQWVFNKTLLTHDSDNDDSDGAGQYLQLVISASRGLVPLSRQEIIRHCLGELGRVLPAIRGATLLKGTVIKEVSATFSPVPGSDQWRPSQKSPLPGLFLAGDWTRTGWPATMEGAVRSGYLAAEAILAAPGKFLKPDLPAEGLARFWARGAVGPGADGLAVPHGDQ